VSLSGVWATGDVRTELSRASASNYALNLDYNMAAERRRDPGRGNVAAAQSFARPFPLRHRGVERRACDVRRADSSAGGYHAAGDSQTRLWQNSGGVSLAPLTGVQLGVDATSTRDLRDYGDSTTIGRLLRQQRSSLFGSNVGIETQRVIRR